MKQHYVIILTILITAAIGGCAQNHEGGSAEVQTRAEPSGAVAAKREYSRENVSEDKLTTQIPMDAYSVQAPEPAMAEMEMYNSVAKAKHDQAMNVRQGKMVSPILVQDAIRQSVELGDRENYAHFDNNPVKLVSNTPVSTFSIDVDTGAYSNVRRILNSGQLPRKDAVRIEELINYFSYDYAAPKSSKHPFAAITEVAPSPWNKDAHLLHIGIKGYADEKRPAANLVFLVDVSGSMNSPAKLGLLKSSLKLLSKQLTKDDRIAIAVYAGASGTVLESTPGNDVNKIQRALDSLDAGGSTNGAAGIKLAYSLAEDGFIKGGINRVMLATDGDFNVGTTNFEVLKELVEKKRETGVSLTTMGFGSGNYNDHLMEQLADVGNGNYAYIDTLNEANKVLVEELGSTLQTIAKDVKIQIEFNPAEVSQYRLVGYENRMLNREDFNNDKIDAGEIGAGHSVTAIYEIILADAGKGWIEPLRYQSEKTVSTNGELAELRIRYKEPEGSKSTLIKWPLLSKDLLADIRGASDDFRFAASVAGFGQLLRGGDMLQGFSYDDILALARKSRGNDEFGYRGEFLQLVSLANSLARDSAPNSELDSTTNSE